MPLSIFTEEFPGTTIPAGWTQVGNVAAQDFSFNGQANLNFHTPERYISSGLTLIRTGEIGSTYSGYLKFKLSLSTYNFPSQCGGSPVLRTRFGTFPPPDYSSSNVLGLGVEFSKARFATTWSGVARPGWNTGEIHSFTADLAKPYYRFDDNGTDVTFSNSPDGLTYAPLKTWAGASKAEQIPQILRWEGDLTGWTAAVNSGWPNPAVNTTMVLDHVEWQYWTDPPLLTEVAATHVARWNVARNNIVGAHSGTRVRFTPTG